jgi:hypothetical protein
MNRIFVVLLAVLGLLLAVCAMAEDLDTSLDTLAAGLADSIEKAGLQRIGIPEFTSGGGKLGGNTGAAGQYVAEKLEEFLFNKGDGKFSIVERRKLNTVLQEAKIQASGLTDEKTSQDLLGKIKGLDSLVVGNLTRTGKSLKLSAKVVRLPEADFVGIKSGSADLDSDLVALFGDTVVLNTGEDSKPPMDSDVVTAVATTSPKTNIATKVAKSPYRIEVLVDGKAKAIHPLGKNLYVAANRDEVFSIKLVNDTDRRVAVALFIDGLNTLGRKRELPSEARKWIVNANSSATIAGWQVDESKAKQLVFVGEEESLAARMHYTDEIGIITASFYPEAVTPEPPAGITKEVDGGRGLGTGEGEEIESKTTVVEFKSVEVPSAIVTLHYDSAEAVKKLEKPSDE